jgi:hypothetical protein
LKCGLIVFGNYEPISRSPVTTYYFEENLSQFEKLITGIEFEDGGMRENAVAEGLVAALEVTNIDKFIFLSFIILCVNTYFFIDV